MNWLSRLEPKLRRFTIPNLTKVLVAGQVVLFLGALANPQIVSMMGLAPAKIREGEIWRLITFIFTPPFGVGAFGPLMALIGIWVFWFTGKAVENHLDTVRFNLYVLVCLLVSVVITVALSFVPGYGAVEVGNRALVTCLFLGFAHIYPNFQFLLFFVLPVKVKYLAWITWAVILIETLGAARTGALGIAVLVGSTPTGYLVFFGAEIIQRLRGKKRSMQRKAEENKEMVEAFHTCSVCGKTDKTDPEMHFRYAQTATGTVCYCEEHAPSAEQAPD